MKKWLLAALSALAISAASPMMTLQAAFAAEWDLAKAAAPFKGTQLNVIFLDRPGYRAIIKLLPEFEHTTGIKVNYEIVPYENTREKQVLNFNSKGILSSRWSTLSGWASSPKRLDRADRQVRQRSLDHRPEPEPEGLLPALLDAFGSWGGKVYGLPFDNYSGLLFYNACMLKDAGFDKPPATWEELYTVYAPEAHPSGEEAIRLRAAVAARRDAIRRQLHARLWPFGGSLLDKSFHSNLNSPERQAGLKFRQDLMKYMPPGVVSYDHSESVNALAQNQVAMITEWSAFYGTLTDPTTSKLGDCLAVAPEPAGPAGRLAGARRILARGRLAGHGSAAEGVVALHPVGDSEAIARAYVEAGGVSGRTSIYEQPDIKAKYKFVEPMVASWQKGVPEFRPRFPAWPAISEVVAEFGSKMMLGEVRPKRARSTSARAWRTSSRRKATTTARRRCCSRRALRRPRPAPRPQWPSVVSAGPVARGLLGRPAGGAKGV